MNTSLHSFLKKAEGITGQAKVHNGYIYLIHFDQPIAKGHQARHYLGFSKDIAIRIQAHWSGRGANLTKVANERGISYRIVRAWKGTRNDERRLKNQKNTPRLCPCCNEAPQNPTWLPALSNDELQSTLLPF